MSAATIYKWEAGTLPRPEPTRPKLVDIARVLGWDPDAVLGWMGQLPLSPDERALVIPVASMTGQREELDRYWPWLSRRQRGALIEAAAAMAETGHQARPDVAHCDGDRVTVFRAASPVGPRSCAQGLN